MSNGTSLRNTLGLAWRQLRRDIRAGEVRILLAALVLAVLAVTAVGLITDRAERALALEANKLLGGDAVLRGDAPMAGSVLQAAQQSGLRHAQTVELDSMVGAGDAVRLGELHALGSGFPLRGAFRIRDALGERELQGVPSAGTVWLSQAGADQLAVQPGDAVTIGERDFPVAALVVSEPSAALDYFNTAPRVFLNAADLESTGLVQPGSRLRYRLIVAGPAAAVQAFTDAARRGLQRGQRIETAGEMRPELRSALDRAGRFLGLATMVSVILAAVAVAMAARRHSARQLPGAAVMRCLGASQRLLVGIHVGELLLLGLLACTAGVALAWGLQAGVAAWLAQRLHLDIPPASAWPLLQGYAVGLLVLLAFAAPPVLALRRVPALRVLRHDVPATEASAWIVLLAALAGLALLLWWQAGSAVLGTWMLLGVGITALVLALLSWLLVDGMRRLRRRLRGSLRYGLANVGRRPATSIAQITALGLGIMALLLLTFVRTDLIERWQLVLEQDAPNRFIINVQPDQVKPLAEFALQRGLREPALFPMVRARLVSRNGQPATGAQVADRGPRAQRMAEREFNLSTADRLDDDNTVTAGAFWSGPVVEPELSVETGFAETLGWKIGDRIGFDIAGQPLEATITSLRDVEWESFQPNFFVLVSPGVLDGYPASHITALQVPASDRLFTADVMRRFPNLTVIDVDAVLQQVRSTADQVSQVVQVVFWFALAAGLLVLLAAVSASQDERLQEGAVMRVLGASTRQLRLAQASEFAAIGLLSGLVAAVAASALSGVIATHVFELPWQPNARMALAGAALGMLAALSTGLLATRRIVRVPPTVVLRETAQ